MVRAKLQRRPLPATGLWTQDYFLVGTLKDSHSSPRAHVSLLGKANQSASANTLDILSIIRIESLPFGVPTASCTLLGLGFPWLA